MSESTLQWKDQSRFVHDIVFQFEKAFKEGKQPEVSAYLQGEGELRQKLLIELLQSDLELRLRAGDVLQVLDYLERFPELRQHHDQLASLLKAEIRCLRQLGREPMFQKYAADYGSILGSGIDSLFKQDESKPVEVQPGLVIAGRYKLLGELGEGGMGTVYAAEQLHPVHRTVALKLIKLGMDSRAVLARFEAERQALALMDHPSIAKMYDGGLTEQGHPFFVMEMVKGLPLNKYCDQEKLSLQDRLKLFIDICQAVQHAHQKGVIHRDLKPTNILVMLQDGKAVPKVIDFGLAKALNQKLTERTLFTEAGRMVGTPEYMAPEQADLNNLDVDTRADVYALGIILYELLTGELPFTSKDLRKAAHHEMLRMIREIEPPWPSIKLSSSANLPKVAALRQSEPKQLSSMIAGELDWVVMKCLEKQRANRYDTPNAIADELRRWLNGEVILARPASTMTRVTKWIKRNPTPSMAMGGVALLLIGLMVAAFWFQDRLHVAREESRIEAESMTRAHELVKALGTTEISQVPRIIEELKPLRSWADPLIKSAASEASQDSAKRVRYALAQLPLDSAPLENVVEYLRLKASPQELLVICQSLSPYRDKLRIVLWNTALNEKTPSDQRFRSACSLATLDRDNPAWERLAPFVALELVQLNPQLGGDWGECLRPVSNKYLPFLIKHAMLDSQDDLSIDLSEEEQFAFRHIKSTAVSKIGEYARESIDILAHVLTDTDSKEFALLFPLLEGQREKAIVCLLAEMTKGSPSTDLNAKQSMRHARRSANAAVALCKLGESSKVWPYLQKKPDPSTRTHFIQLYKIHKADPAPLIRQIDSETDGHQRRTLLLCLGQYSEQELAELRLRSLIPSVMLLQWYENDPDPGTHGTLRWLLQQWGQQKELARMDSQLATGKVEGHRNWYYTKSGQFMTVINGPVTFQMSSPQSEPGRKPEEKLAHPVTIHHRYAIAATAITNSQYRQIVTGYVSPDGVNPEDACPVAAISWFEAAKYCNLLNKKEGIPESEWCYEPNEAGKYDYGMKIVPNFLSKTGYRLPLEEEWEYACRADAHTSWFFGSCEEWLPKYAWYSRNAKLKTWPVGTKIPNDFGLFDMHGNSLTWCQNGPNKSQLLPNSAAEIMIENQTQRSLRGGSFVGQPAGLRASSLYVTVPDQRQARDVGFRVARTIK